MGRAGPSVLGRWAVARDGPVIADVVRLDKGHTEGLEPRITEDLIMLVVHASGGKLRALHESAASGS